MLPINNSYNLLTLEIQTDNIERIGDILPKIVGEATEVYSEIPAFDGSRSSLHRYLYGPTVASEKLKKFVDHRKVKPLKPLLNEMRAFKSENEVMHMRRLGQASGRAFTESMRQTFDREKDLCSFLEYHFKVNGADGSAFVPVVAGGQVRMPSSGEKDPILMTLECAQYPLHPERRCLAVGSHAPFPEN